MSYVRIYVTVEGTYYPYINEKVSWRYDPNRKICDSLDMVKEHTLGSYLWQEEIDENLFIYCPFRKGIVAIGEGDMNIDEDDVHTYEYVFIVEMP